MAITPSRTTVVNSLIGVFRGINGTGDYNNNLAEKVFEDRTVNELFQEGQIPGVNVRTLGQQEPKIYVETADGKQDNPLDIEVDIVANTAAEHDKVVVDLLTAIRVDFRLGLPNDIIRTMFLGDRKEFDQQDKAYKGGTASFRIEHRTNWMRI